MCVGYITKKKEAKLKRNKKRKAVTGTMEEEKCWLAKRDGEVGMIVFSFFNDRVFSQSLLRCYLFSLIK